MNTMMMQSHEFLFRDLGLQVARLIFNFFGNIAK